MGGQLYILPPRYYFMSECTNNNYLFLIQNGIRGNLVKLSGCVKMWEYGVLSYNLVYGIAVEYVL